MLMWACKGGLSFSQSMIHYQGIKCTSGLTDDGESFFFRTKTNVGLFYKLTRETLK